MGHDLYQGWFEYKPHLLDKIQFRFENHNKYQQSILFEYKF